MTGLFKTWVAIEQLCALVCAVNAVHQAICKMYDLQV